MTNEGEVLASALPIYTTIGKPFSVLEIDVHPDRKRIWATLLALSDYLEGLNQESYDRGYKEGFQDGKA